MHRLELLTLSDTNVTDRGIEAIGKLKHLTFLSLDGTSVTDRSMKWIGSLKNLDSLSMNGTQITDAGTTYLLGNRGIWRCWLVSS